MGLSTSTIAEERSTSSPLTRRSEVEAAGDVNKAMQDLLAAYRNDPSNSGIVKLAHELAQRHANSAPGLTCPIRQSGGSVLEKGGRDVEANGTCRERGAPEVLSEGDSISRTISSPTQGEETPWERGWQGPEDFKPPEKTGTDRCQEEETNGVRGQGGGRNFTIDQLRHFDGDVNPRSKDPRPIYIALRRVVYDATAGAELYGPGGKYCALAGTEASRCVSRGLTEASPASAEEMEGAKDLSLEGLSRFEEMTLDGWVDTFAARGYPVVGRVVETPPPRVMAREELRQFDGKQEFLPPGYALPPIYIGVGTEVFDVSFGGADFYTDGGPYECLAGRDASRVLAKMSMAKEDVDGLLDYSCLTEKEKKNLCDWADKLGGKRGYPVVGWLEVLNS
ncbi:unnamed protein product [Discosporangium mesarthrocarpum]